MACVAGATVPALIERDTTGLVVYWEVTVLPGLPSRPSLSAAEPSDGEGGPAGCVAGATVPALIERFVAMTVPPPGTCRVAGATVPALIERADHVGEPQSGDPCCRGYRPGPH